MTNISSILCFADRTLDAPLQVEIDVQAKVIQQRFADAHVVNSKDLDDDPDLDAITEDKICLGLFVPKPKYIPNALWPQQDWVDTADAYYKLSTFHKYAGRKVVFVDDLENDFKNALKQVPSHSKVFKDVTRRKAYPVLKWDKWRSPSLKAVHKAMQKAQRAGVRETFFPEEDAELFSQKHRTLLEKLAENITDTVLENFEHSLARRALLVQENIRMHNEYRIFVVNGRPVSGAGWIPGFTPKQNQGVDFDPAVENIQGDKKVINQPKLVERYREFAAQAAQEFMAENPDCKHYTLDLALDKNDEIVIVELNSLYNMGLFATRFEPLLDAIIDDVSRPAYTPSERPDLCAESL